MVTKTWQANEPVPPHIFSTRRKDKGHKHYGKNRTQRGWEEEPRYILISNSGKR